MKSWEYAARKWSDRQVQRKRYKFEQWCQVCGTDWFSNVGLQPERKCPVCKAASERILTGVVGRIAEADRFPETSFFFAMAPDTDKAR